MVVYYNQSTKSGGKTVLQQLQ